MVGNKGEPPFPSQSANHRRFCRISEESYTKEIKAEIEKVIRLQEEIGLDVLVHGEPEVSL